MIAGSELRFNQHVNCNRQEQHRQHPFEHIRSNALDRQCSRGRADKRQDESAHAIAPLHRARVSIMERGAPGPERCLKFVRAQRQFWVQPDTQQDWQRQQPASTRDRVHKARGEPSPEQQQKLP